MAITIYLSTTFCCKSWWRLVHRSSEVLCLKVNGILAQIDGICPRKLLINKFKGYIESIAATKNRPLQKRIVNSPLWVSIKWYRMISATHVMFSKMFGRLTMIGAIGCGMLVTSLLKTVRQSSQLTFSCNHHPKTINPAFSLTCFWLHLC